MKDVAFESANQYELLFDAMVEGVVVQNANGELVTANAAAEQILGAPIAAMRGVTSMDPRWKCVHEDGTDFPGTDHPASVALRTGKPALNVIMGVHKPAGELTWVSVNALPRLADDGKTATSVIVTFHDITAIKAAQAAAERLSRQERFVTTGTLAAGIGHEINNPLAFIMANLEFSIEEVRAIGGGSPSGRLRELINVLVEAREGAERIRKIVRGLRALARDESEPVPSEIEPIVDVSLNIATHELRLKASVEKNLGPTPPVLADEARLTQVLINLLVNAAQAFPGGDIEQNRIVVSSFVVPDGRVCLTVSDNGPGVPPDIRHRIFDPFFTTKAVGQGTGLGLSISMGIVQALGGELTLEETTGGGATFRVTLPAADQSFERRQSTRPAPQSRGTVLVIDDDKTILSSIRRVLDKDHEVVTSHDPREALQRIRSGERFDVVFCDLMMPHLSGDVLFAQVKAIDPELAERFVFITGGQTLGPIQSFLAEVPNERVEKPFSMQNLRGIARRFVRARSD